MRVLGELRFPGEPVLPIGSSPQSQHGVLPAGGIYPIVGGHENLPARGHLELPTHGQLATVGGRIPCTWILVRAAPLRRQSSGSSGLCW